MKRDLLGLALVACFVVPTTHAADAAPAKAGAVKVPFGKTSGGKDVDLFVLTTPAGVTAKIITYGATVTELWVPDASGKLADVLLGFDDDMKGWQSKGNPFFNCIVGRYANRIAKGKFTLDGKEYKLATNNGKNHLHGGDAGFDKKVWKAAKPTPVKNKDGKAIGSSIAMSYQSPDGEEGYPGTLDATVTYSLTSADGVHTLKIHYTATTDKATPVNLTNHAYFNLAGQNSGDILGHELTFMASNITPTDESYIPTGKIAPVKGTPYDFTKPTAIGSRIAQIKGEPGGYDINYVLDRKGGKGPLKIAAVVTEPKSGRVMEMRTTEAGVQFYTGNFLDGTVKGKGGTVYKKHAGFCLEAQVYPDSPNQKDFPSSILVPGKKYAQTTEYRFSTAK
jgi:aldose 1-epimerase